MFGYSFVTVNVPAKNSTTETFVRCVCLPGLHAVLSCVYECMGMYTVCMFAHTCVSVYCCLRQCLWVGVGVCRLVEDLGSIFPSAPLSVYAAVRLTNASPPSCCAAGRPSPVQTRLGTPPWIARPVRRQVTCLGVCVIYADRIFPLCVHEELLSEMWVCMMMGGF